MVKSLSLAATVVPSAALPGSYLLSLDTANLVCKACSRVSTHFPKLVIDGTVGLTLQTRTLALKVLSVHAFSRSWIMQESSYAKPNGDLAVAAGSRMLMKLRRTTNQTTGIARSSVVIGNQPKDVRGWVDVCSPEWISVSTKGTLECQMMFDALDAFANVCLPHLILLRPFAPPQLGLGMFEHLLVQENAPGYIARHMQVVSISVRVDNATVNLCAFPLPTSCLLNCRS